MIETLFSKYYNELLLYTLSLCHNEHLAQEIVSTAFFKALVSAEKNEADFKPWLFVVCRNEYFSICRKKKRFTALQSNIADACVGSDVLDRLILQEEYRSLYRAISLLPQDQREAITLFYFSGLSVRSIAKVMQKSESNVKTTLHRARIKIKTILEETT